MRWFKAEQHGFDRWGSSHAIAQSTDRAEVVRHLDREGWYPEGLGFETTEGERIEHGIRRWASTTWYHETKPGMVYIRPTSAGMELARASIDVRQAPPR